MRTRNSLTISNMNMIARFACCVVRAKLSSGSSAAKPAVEDRVTFVAHELRYDREAFDGKKLCSFESVTAWLQLSSRSSSVSTAYCSGVVRGSQTRGERRSGHKGSLRETRKGE